MELMGFEPTCIKFYVESKESLTKKYKLKQ
jgi:hypothetical protein